MNTQELIELTDKAIEYLETHYPDAQETDSKDTIIKVNQEVK